MVGAVEIETVERSARALLAVCVVRVQPVFIDVDFRAAVTAASVKDANCVHYCRQNAFKFVATDPMAHMQDALDHWRDRLERMPKPFPIRLLSPLLARTCYF